MRRFIRLTISALLVILMVFFAISNRELAVIKLSPLPYQMEIPLFLFGILMLMLGFLWGNMLSVTRHLRVKHAAKREHKKANALSEEVAALRAEKSLSPSKKEAAAAIVSAPSST